MLDRQLVFRPVGRFGAGRNAGRSFQRGPAEQKVSVSTSLTRSRKVRSAAILSSSRIPANVAEPGLQLGPLREAVEDDLAVLSVEEEAGPPELREVGRHSRGRQLENGRQLANTALACFEGGEDPDAGRVGERLCHVESAIQGAVHLGTTVSPRRMPRQGAEAFEEAAAGTENP